MDKFPNQLIIIGGGMSIKEGVEKRLWAKINGQLTYGLNYSYEYFDSTIQGYVDSDFYKREMEKGFGKCGLVVGKMYKGVKRYGNEVMLVDSPHYNLDIHYGVYKSSLCGMFALSVALWLMRDIPNAEIFLLGYDYGVITDDRDENKKEITHFYQGEIEHRGIGKTNYYKCKGRGKRDYDVYVDKSIKTKIWNVSPNSNIPSFEKINYNTFFDKLQSNRYNQDELRETIKNKLMEVEKWQTQNWKELKQNLLKSRKNKTT